VSIRIKNLREQYGRKTFRYTMVSVVSVLVGQVVLVVCNAGLGWSGVTSNIVAVCVGAVPSYFLNRYWTWGKRGRNHFLTEVLPFWAMALLGLAFSTWLVALADERWGTTLAVSAANFLAFGSLWVAKFLLLNQLLFRAHQDDLPPALDGRTGLPT
jgi:putative flippase GtrA